MKKIPLFSLFLLLALTLPAQTLLKKDYAISPAFDAGTAIQAVAGTYVIFGNLRASTSSTSTDIYMLRLDANGNQVSLTKYGASNSSESIGRGVVPLTDGWLLAGGKGTKGYLMQINTTGAVTWTKEITGASPFNDAAFLPDGSIVATGKNGNNMFLCRLTADGTPIWIKSYSAGNGVRLALSEGKGNCFVVGSNKIWKLRLTDGTLIWEKTLAPAPYGPDGGYQSLTLTDITAAGPGQFAIIGSFLNDQITTLYSAFYTAVLRESGELVWERYFNGLPDGLDYNEGTSIYYMSNEKHLLLAGTESGSGVLTRVDAVTGQKVDSLKLGLSGYTVSPIVSKSGGYYAVTGAKLAGFQNMNTFFYRTAINAFRSVEAPETQASTGIRVYPNPCSGMLCVAFPAVAAGEQRFEILDAAGRVAMNASLAVQAGANESTLQLSALPDGVYWLSLPDAGLAPASFIIKR